MLESVHLLDVSRLCEFQWSMARNRTAMQRMHNVTSWCKQFSRYSSVGYVFLLMLTLRDAGQSSSVEAPTPWQQHPQQQGVCVHLFAR